LPHCWRGIALPRHLLPVMPSSRRSRERSWKSRRLW
jgi:hypothetical protein